MDATAPTDSGSPSPDATTDSGSSATDTGTAMDSAVEDTAIADGAIADGGPPPPPPPAMTDAGNVVSATYGFPVMYSVFQGGGDPCMGGPPPDGGYGSLVVLLADFTPPGDAGLQNGGPVGGHVLRVQITGPSYTGSNEPPDGSAVKPVVPGTYTIGFEGEDDDDLCMLPPGTSAELDVFQYTSDAGAYTQAQAVSGSVKLTAVSLGQVEGTFGVVLDKIVYADGGPFTFQDPMPFTGQFVANQ
jgi:hypothetical protein